jgi:hypothetical protein
MSRMSWVRSSDRLLQVALLGRAQLVVEHDDVGRLLLGQPRHLFGLALADQRGRIAARALLHHAADHLGAGAAGELAQLLHGGFGAGARAGPGGNADQDRVFGRGGAVGCGP